MSNRLCAALVAVVLVMPLPVWAQSGTDAAPLRTPDGQPDISGVFTFRTLTPLQRPEALEGQATLSAEDAAAFAASERRRLNRDTFDPESGAPSAGYQSRAEGGVLSYNEFWYERGIELTSDKRTSLVVDPPDGRIPYTPEFAEANRLRRLNLRNGFADHYTDRSLTDRCLMGSNSGPPMRPGSYNNNLQILQIPGYVVLVNEHIHNTRIIPVDGRPHGNVRQWVGDSRGRWDGDTLVIETTRINWPYVDLGGAPLSEDARILERLTLSDDQSRLDYHMTIIDPAYLTEPATLDRYWLALGLEVQHYECVVE